MCVLQVEFRPTMKNPRASNCSSDDENSRMADPNLSLIHISEPTRPY